MKFKYLKYTAPIAGLFLSGIALTGCADENGITTPESDLSSGIVLRLPNFEGAAEFPQTRAAGATVNADGTTEGNINDLYLYIFRNDEFLKSINLKETSAAQNVTSTSYKDYSLGNLEAGSYKFYILANTASYVEDGTLSGLTSVDDIKNVALSFKDGKIEPNNLPMACMSVIGDNWDSVQGENSSVTITENDAVAGKAIYADLSFLCSKVRYTILFDNSAEGISSSFGTNVVDFGTNVSISNILKKGSVGSEIFTSENADFTNLTAPLGHYSYPGPDYPDASSANLSETTDSYAKCAWQGTVYLPSNTNSKQTVISLAGVCKETAGSNDALYNISKDIPLCPADVNNGKFTRGNMYDIIVKVKNYDGINITATCSPWLTTNILGDLVHTYLTLSKTTGSVSSTEKDIITYSTDGRGLSKSSFQCADNGGLYYVKSDGTKGDKVTDKPVINIYDLNTQDKTMTFSVNPNIDITTLYAENNKIEGTATCYITAGNIKKEIKIKYNLTPYFEITPPLHKIRYTAGSAELTKEFVYETNLGGVVLKGRIGESNASTVFINGSIKSSTSKVGNSTITISCDNPTSGSGVIKVTASSFSGIETMVHLFTATSIKTPSTGAITEDLEVQVMPPLGDYYINFRAINDYQPNGGGEFLGGDLSKFPNEGSNNWIDWWSSDNNSTYSDNNHLIYIYGQNGESLTVDGATDSWHFNNFVNSYNDNVSANQKMTHSSIYPGWYSYQLSQNATANNGKKPEPGKTLLIFYANRNTVGEEVHRAPHHMDAGITLFDYEDREGWILYDPTRSPYFTIYDDKPEIEDVTYHVYTKKPVYSWYNKYGNKSGGHTTYDDEHQQWVLQHTLKEGESDDQKNGWYKTDIKLKAPKGEYAKAIKINTINENGYYTIFFRVYKNDSNWVNSDSAPYVYLYGGKKGEYKPFDDAKRNPACKMTYVATDAYGYIFKYDIPYGYHDGSIIFIANNNSFFQTDDIKINSLEAVLYSSQNENKKHMEEGYSTYQCTLYQSTTIFNGQVFPNNTGYYNGASWSATPN